MHNLKVLNAPRHKKSLIVWTEGTAVRDFDATSASVRTTYACVYILNTM